MRHAVRQSAALRRRLGHLLCAVSYVTCAFVLGGIPEDASAAIVDLPTSGKAARHPVAWAALQGLNGGRLGDARGSALLAPHLKRLLGSRYADFIAALGEEAPLRVEGAGLVGEGVVPNSLGYRGAFFVFGRNGDVLVVTKGGRHGTAIERIGALELLKEPALLHAYQEFLGIDE